MSGISSDIPTNSRSRIFLISFGRREDDALLIEVCDALGPVSWREAIVGGTRGDGMLVELANVGMLTNEETGIPRGRPER